MSDQDNVVDLGELLSQVEARRQEEAEGLAESTPEKQDDGGGGGPDDPQWVLDCLAANELGDGYMFAALHRDKFVFDKSSERWLEFPENAHHWQYDEMGRVVTGVEEVALRYLQQAVRISELLAELREKLSEVEAKCDACKDADDADGAALARLEAGRLSGEIKRFTSKRSQLYKRVDRERSENGVRKTLFWAHSIEKPLAVLGKHQLDQEPMLFACGNGVIDLEVGQLRPGKPSDWLVKASPVSLPDGIDHYLRTGDNCPCPTWDAFQKEILGDEEVAHFWHKLLGFSLSGLVTEHIITVAVGAGRNGKGTSFERLQDIYGDYSWVISPELILEQKNARSSQGAAADIVSLSGRRLIVGAETDDNRRISGASVKSLTGGDTLKARPLYQADEIQITPTWKLFLHTNSVPKGLTKDFALQQRLVYVTFPFSYVDDPVAEGKRKPAMAEFYRRKDRGLPLRLAKEDPGILAWLVRGNLLWQREGLQPPARIQADIEQLRKDEDVVGQFATTRCAREETADTKLKELYEGFETWHKDNQGDHVISRKRFAADLVSRGYRKDTVGGNVRIYGLRLLNDWELENA